MKSGIGCIPSFSNADGLAQMNCGFLLCLIRKEFPFRFRKRDNRRWSLFINMLLFRGLFRTACHQYSFKELLNNLNSVTGDISGNWYW